MSRFVRTWLVIVLVSLVATMTAGASAMAPAGRGAYLEDVQPNGRVTYVTEGELALADRACVIIDLGAISLAGLGNGEDHHGGPAPSYTWTVTASAWTRASVGTSASLAIGEQRV